MHRRLKVSKVVSNKCHQYQDGQDMRGKPSKISDLNGFEIQHAGTIFTLSTQKNKRNCSNFLTNNRFGSKMKRRRLCLKAKIGN